MHRAAFKSGQSTRETNGAKRVPTPPTEEQARLTTIHGIVSHDLLYLMDLIGLRESDSIKGLCTGAFCAAIGVFIAVVHVCCV